MRKGIGLISLIIFLLAAGIIISIIIRGKDLLETSKDINEVETVNKLRNAVQSYISYNQSMYEENNYLSVARLVAEGYLTSIKDADSRYKQFLGEPFQYQLFNYFDEGTYFSPERTLHFPYKVAVSNVKTTSIIDQKKLSVPIAVVCVMEMRMDDTNPTSGAAKMVLTGTSDITDSKKYANAMKSPCSKSLELKSADGMPGYAMIIN